MWANISEVENGWINDLRFKAEKPLFKRDRIWEKSWNLSLWQ
jgi:hypothetical protein